ncbi:MAG: UPF0104 family protein [Candidatus Kerfeldbacteria bacterium]|nr:UPF0104 family protein [Candidatus Kerfeldbacteria bacterium]
MTASTIGSGQFGAIRRIGSWLVAAVVFWFLFRRLAHDWPVVQPMLRNLSWPWLTGAFAACFIYFAWQIIGWREILRSLGVASHFWTAAKVWMNGEIIRYVPGNLWSFLGRMAQAEKLATSKTVIGASMAMEALVMVMSATALAAILLISYPRYMFLGRSYLLLLIAFLAVVLSTNTVAKKFVHLIFRIFRRGQEFPLVRGLTVAFGAKTAAWIMFAVFQIFIMRGLGLAVNGMNWLIFSGIFIASWLLGYLSFITPSGLGVREALLTWFFAPYLGTGQAILVAVVSRLALTLIELATLGLVNGIAREKSDTLES